jgi:hypothetical protein
MSESVRTAVLVTKIVVARPVGLSDAADVRRALLLALALAGVIRVPLAGAEGRRADVRWEAPAGCPTAEEFRVLVGDDARPAIARVVVWQIDGGWRAWMVIDGSVRELQGVSCDEVASAAALVVAIGLRAIDQPSIVQLPAPPPPPPLRLLPPATVVELEPVVAASPGPPATWSVGIGVGIDLGTLPQPAPEARLGVGVRGSRLAIAFDAAFATAGGTVMGEVDTTFRLFSAGVRACAGRRWAWLCVGVDAGAMTAGATEGAARASGDGWWLAARAGPELIGSIAGDWEVVAGAELGAPLVYPRFTIDGALVHDPGGIAFRTSLAIQRAFR